MDENADAVIEHVGPHGFDATLARLTEAIGRAGLILFARIDHSAGAREVGLAMPPTTVLIYGHPKGGTPLMLASPFVALDLPLRVLVREREDGEDGGGVPPGRPIAAPGRGPGRHGVPARSRAIHPSGSLEALKP